MKTVERHTQGWFVLDRVVRTYRRMATEAFRAWNVHDGRRYTDMADATERQRDQHS